MRIKPTTLDYYTERFGSEDRVNRLKLFVDFYATYRRYHGEMRKVPEAVLAFYAECWTYG